MVFKKSQFAKSLTSWMICFLKYGTEAERWFKRWVNTKTENGTSIIQAQQNESWRRHNASWTRSPDCFVNVTAYWGLKGNVIGWWSLQKYTKSSIYRGVLWVLIDNCTCRIDYVVMSSATSYAAWRGWQQLRSPARVGVVTRSVWPRVRAVSYHSFAAVDDRRGWCSRWCVSPAPTSDSLLNTCQLHWVARFYSSKYGRFLSVRANLSKVRILSP